MENDIDNCRRIKKHCMYYIWDNGSTCGDPDKFKDESKPFSFIRKNGTINHIKKRVLVYRIITIPIGFVKAFLLYRRFSTISEALNKSLSLSYKIIKFG